MFARAWIAVLLLTGLTATARGQSITAAESFFDNPAVAEGAGSSLAPIQPLGPAGMIEVSVDASMLSVAPHAIFLRVQDDQGDYSDPIALPFHLRADGATDLIVAAETFLDADPGLNNAQPVTVDADRSVSLGAAVSVSALQVGPHAMGIRLIDAAGIGSATILQPFNLRPGGATDLIVAAETFFDADPGLNNAQAIAGDPDRSVSLGAAVNLSALQVGPHAMGIRLIDAAGVGSATILQPFSLRVIGEAGLISSAEGYFDVDPGIGSGIPIPLNMDRAVTVAAAVDLSTLATGSHSFGFRVMDAGGVASTTLQQPIALRQGFDLVPEIVEAESFLESDPGLGAGAPMMLSPVAANPVGVIAEHSVDLIASITNMQGGLIGARVLDAGGIYSPNIIQTVSVADLDGDGIPDLVDAFPMDPLEWRDTDDDGIGNNSDPDIDGDGLLNDDDDDDDGDGMSDEFEDAFGLDRRDPADSLRDSDLDGLSNLQEFEIGTDPTNPDTDGDGLRDGDDPTPRIAGILNEVPAPAEIDAGDQFGASVAIDGDLFVAGSPEDEGGGAVYAYRIVGGQPVLEGRIPVPEGFAADEFGASVSIQGDTLVIGAPGTPVIAKGSGLSALRAAIFQRTNQEWNFKQSLASDAGDGDEFGMAVSIDGDMLVVGAPNDDESGTAHVFELAGNNWVAMGKVRPAVPQPGERFGSAVSVSQRKFAAASPNSQFGAMTTGTVSIFQAISGNLAELGSIAGSASASGAEFGASVSLTGDTLVVGAPGEMLDRGAIYAYDTSNQIVELQRIVPADGSAGDRLGEAVSSNQDLIAAGAPMAGGAGAFYTFRADTFEQQERFEATREAQGFGTAVAVSGDRILVGAPNTRETGAVALQRDAQSIFRDGFE